LRLAQADYIYAQHNYGAGNPTFVDNVRLSAGIVLNAGGGEALPVSSSCSVDKTEVWAGEPVKATVSPSNFNPKHTLKYDWTTNGGKVQGEGASVNIDTTGVAEGQSYNVSVQVSDPKDKKALTSCQTSFATKKRLPPTISCTATPNSVIQGGAVTIHCDASSPQGSPVTVAVTSDCGASGQGNDVSIDTSRLQPGACNVTGTVTDDHQLTATTNTSFTVQPKPLPPPPPPPVAPPPTLVLRSVYFGTAQPTEENPNGGLVKSQEATLTEIASEFKKYLAVKPDAKLIIEAHADPRGSEEYNQKLTERRAQRVKSLLVEHGVPEGNIQPVGLGTQHQLTPDEVREQVESNSDLTPNERRRILRNMRTIVLASNRRVDLRVTAPGVPEQTSVHKFPWNAADALSLIGGREKRTPAKAPAKKRPARKKK
jgi:outer membrane protein OmpA-like peptidoglycan-associated protein